MTILSRSLVAAESAAAEFEIQPDSLSCCISAQFDDKGKVRHANSNSNLSLKVIPLAGVVLVGSRGVRVTECITEAGESMLAKNTGNDAWSTGQNTFQDFRCERNEYTVNCQLAAPSQLPNALRSLDGTVTLVVANGASKQARITPIKEWVGKPVEIESINEEVVFERTAFEIKLPAVATCSSAFRSSSSLMPRDARSAPTVGAAPAPTTRKMSVPTIWLCPKMAASLCNCCPR